MSHFPTVETCAAVAFALRPFFAFCFFRNWTPPEKGEEENSTHYKMMRVNHCITTVELTSNVFCPFSFRYGIQNIFHVKCLCTCDGNTTPRRWRMAAPQRRKKRKYHRRKERGEAAPPKRQVVKTAPPKGMRRSSNQLHYRFLLSSQTRKKGGTAAPHEGEEEVKSSTTHKGEGEPPLCWYVLYFT